MKKETAFESFSKVFDKEIRSLLTTTWQEKNVYGYIQNLFKSVGATILENPPLSMDVAIAVPDSLNCLGVVEVKIIGSSEMITVTDFNKKALWQILYYYLAGAFSQEERLNTLEYYIITDLQEWYLFDNRSFVNSLDGRTASRLASDIGLNTKNPSLFSVENKNKAYDHLKAFCDSNPDFLRSLMKNCIHIGIPTTGDQTKQVRLLFERLYDMFCPNKEKPALALNDNFYKELLYIMGLKEAKNTESKVMELVYNGVQHTFANQLDPTLKEGDPLKQEDMQRLIIWFNRILFLKLLETSLIKFNEGNDDYKFLSSKRLTDFATLNKLFFRVLAVEEDQRTDKDFEGVPYLNSSLFEEHEVEKGCNISSIPNEFVPYYSDTVLQTENGKKRTGEVRLLDYLLEFLDAYDFGSGKETTAGKIISPAVLGLVFEKLNGYKDGSYYTPENITSFMAEEAIKSSFVAQVNEALHTNYESYDIIKRSFIQSLFSDEEKEAIKKLITSLKILDPAVGSGHFLVSAMDVLLRIWYDFCVGPFDQLMDYRLNDDNVLVDRSGKPVDYIRRQNKGTFDIDKAEQSVQKAFFEAKKYIIEHNLYGVDINPNAVEIAKLRLWIELLENAYYREPDYEQMETLPNLEFKIICADSLIPLENTNQLSFLSPYIEDMKQLMHRYFEESDKARKEAIKTKEFPELLSQIKEAASFGGSSVKDKLDTWNPFGNSPATFFDPELMFGTDQFDVIITNPPYIQLQRNGGELAKKYAPYSYETFDRKGDIYTLFIERGLNMLQDNGYLCYITSNKWLRSGYGGKVRSYLLNKNSHAQLDILIDLGPGVFENAAVDTCILGVKKVTSPSSLGLKTLDLTKEDITTANISECLNDPDKVTVMTKLDSGPWFFGKDIDQRIKEKVETFGVPLKGWKVDIYYGIKTGCNDAFIIDSDTRKKILDGCRSDEELKLTNSVIKKRLRGKNVNRYSCSWDGNWIIVIPSGWTNQMKGSSTAEDFMNANLPSLMGHLNTYKDRLLARDDKGDYWWELRPCSYYDEFDKEKVIWREIVNRPSFYYDNEHFYVEATGFIMTGDNLKYLCGVLNSKPCAFVFKRYYSGGGLGEEGYRYKKAFMMALPVPPVTLETEGIARRIEENVEKITNSKKQDTDADTSALEQEIDNLVYELYGLTEEERQYINQSVP